MAEGRSAGSLRVRQVKNSVNYTVRGAARKELVGKRLNAQGLTRTGQTAAEVRAGAQRRAMAVLKGGRNKAGGGRRG